MECDSPRVDTAKGATYCHNAVSGVSESDAAGIAGCAVRVDAMLVASDCGFAVNDAVRGSLKASGPGGSAE